MVNVRVIGYASETPEYSAALDLKRLFEKAFSDCEDGQILIRPNVTCYGQRVKDIDLVVLAQFDKGVKRKLWCKASSNENEEQPAHRNVYINNFCICIEVKDHPQQRIKFERLAALVEYNGKWFNASAQSEEQKYSLKRLFDDQLGWSPYICNLIWFRNLSKDQLPNYLSNLLPRASDLSLLRILECVAAQRIPKKKNAYYVISSMRKQNNDLQTVFGKAFDLLNGIATRIGTLTRDKLERITKTLLKDQQYAESVGQRLVVVRGRAGTGKTIKLLHIAHDLCTRRGKRCLILTYNKALASDIRRIIALARIDTGIDSGSIDVRTVHQFMYSVMDGFGLVTQRHKRFDQNVEHKTENVLGRSTNGDRLSLDKDDFFIRYYDDLKAELLAHLHQHNEDVEVLFDLYKDDLKWDIVLVDEGQDWPNDERDILFMLFKPSKLIVADGVDQLVRGSRRTDWTVGVDYHRPIISEKRSLRQKANLCRFEQSYAELVGLDWDLLPNDHLSGGRVIITPLDYNRELHMELMTECEATGNGPYEMLFLVPPSLVDRKDGDRFFRLAKEWQEWGICVWDGTSGRVRSEYPTDPDQHRVLQYDSCRGLEGWAVVCLHLDEFVYYKFNTYHEESTAQLDLGLHSLKEKARLFAYRWTMMPFTRAIDTLVITIKNPNCAYAKKLRAVAEQCPDFVEWRD